jgi:hypothetical protein
LATTRYPPSTKVAEFLRRSILLHSRVVSLIAGSIIIVSGDAGALDLTESVTVKGFIEGRVALTDGPQGWEHRGLGKTHFGGDGGNRTIVHTEGAAVVSADINWDWTLFLNVSADAGRRRNPVDFVEAFVRYKPAPSGPTSFSAKIGAFFPPISFENTSLAWTSPFTLSSSAINTWVGEEFRTVGGEAKITHRFEGGEVSALGAVFAANDPAGALLAWRGWAVSGREAGLFERLPLAPLRVIQPDGSASQQAPWVEPVHEIDGRPGIYGAVEARMSGLGTARVMIYDNLARKTAFDGDQYAWHTRFLSIGARAKLPGDVDLVAQGMIGDTAMGFVAPNQALVDVGYASAFVLLSRAWDRHRFSVRAEYFETTDRDPIPDDNNGEHGNSVALSYVFYPVDRHRLTVEFLNIFSQRPEREFIGIPEKFSENQVQASYRIFF